jgi:hypothetical protein
MVYRRESARRTRSALRAAEQCTFHQTVPVLVSQAQMRVGSGAPTVTRSAVGAALNALALRQSAPRQSKPGETVSGALRPACFEPERRALGVGAAERPPAITST